jgi:FixJ family two-component response regulator
MTDGLSHRLGTPALRSSEPPLTLRRSGAEYRGALVYRAKEVLEAPMIDSKLISIVDDDPPFRESMRKLVMLIGYPVETFASAADFLKSDLLPETACLIADVHMPGMTGLELHGRLVELGYAIPTILVTAYADDRVRERALQEGVFCYLSKPVDDLALERCICSILTPE